jgi:dihydrofolate synthase/folylpolyglutamate synthase
MFDLPKYGHGICLARMAALLEALGIDRAQLQRISVVVTGSNGKGSTAATCAQIGRAYGLRTGLFTSPHLFRFNERIQIDGTDINDDALDRLKRQVDTAIAEVSKRLGEKFGAFEALFALACLHFQESDCDFAVFEAGIGGRYDPVRLVGAHETCVTALPAARSSMARTAEACGRISSSTIAGAAARRCSSAMISVSTTR